MVVFHVSTFILQLHLGGAFFCPGLPVHILEQLLDLLQLPGFLASRRGQLHQVLDLVKYPLEQIPVARLQIAHKVNVRKEVITHQICRQFPVDAYRLPRFEVIQTDCQLLR